MGSQQSSIHVQMAEQGREALDSEAASLTPTISYKSLCADALLCCLRSLEHVQPSHRAERHGRRRARTTIEDFTQTYFRYHDLRVPEVILLLARHVRRAGVGTYNVGPDGLMPARAGLLQALGHPHLCRRQAPQDWETLLCWLCLFGCIMWGQDASSSACLAVHTHLSRKQKASS